MTIQHIDIDSENFEDAPKALRDYAKQLKKALEERETEVGTLRGQLHSRALADVLADKGFKNPKRVERDLLSDKVDPLDTEAVNAWLAENGDDYAKGEATPAAPPVQQDPNAAGHQAIQQVVREGTPVDAQTAFERAQAELGPNPTGEEVLRVYAKYGI